MGVATSNPNGDGGADIWIVLTRSVHANPPPTAAKAETSDKKQQAWKTLRWKLFFVSADIVGMLVWTYVLLKLFVVDIDRVILDSTLPTTTWILGYKLVVLIGLLVLISMFFWRVGTLVLILYVMFFPLILLFWKLPWFVAKRESWAFVMVALNAAGNLIRNLRYISLTKGLWLLAAFAILAFDNDIVVGTAALTLMGLVAWSIVRSIRDSFRPNWFLSIQETAIAGIMNSPFRASITLEESDLPPNNDVILSDAQVNSVVSKIQLAVLANRFIYFWAYRLQQYKQSQMSAIFNGAAYLFLFVGCAVSFGLVNLALLKVDPGQYQFDAYPSTVTMLAYGMSPFFGSSASGVSAHGDIAHVLGMVGGLCGPVFIGIFVLNLFFVSRRHQDDTTLAETVAGLRQQAVEHAAEFRAAMRVTVAEACNRLTELEKFGLNSFYDFITRDIPAEFLAEDAPVSRSR